MAGNKALVVATDFSDKHAVIVSGYEALPGGKLAYIEKLDGKWELTQTIDLDEMLIEHSPIFVVSNDRWMVLTAIPKDTGKKDEETNLTIFAILIFP